MSAACQPLRDAPTAPVLNDGTRLPEGHSWAMTHYVDGSGSPSGHDWDCAWCGARAIRKGLINRRWIAVSA